MEELQTEKHYGFPPMKTITLHPSDLQMPFVPRDATLLHFWGEHSHSLAQSIRD